MPLAFTITEVGFDGLPGELGHGRLAPFGLVTEAGVKVVRQLDGRALHGMPAYQ